MVKMKDSSDTQWDASQDSKEQFKQLINIAANPNTSSRLNVTAVLNYKFTRAAPASSLVVSGQRTKPINDTVAFADLASFTNCSDLSKSFSLPINYLIPKRLRLGQSTTVSAIKVQLNDNPNESDDFETALITFSCNNYWSFTPEAFPD